MCQPSCSDKPFYFPSSLLLLVIDEIKKYVLIVAGGTGLRMQADVPKQFLEIGGRPVLMHTIEKFCQTGFRAECLLVLPENQFDAWLQLCEKHSFLYRPKLIVGGKTRFDSVHNGLKTITDKNALVAIHDGVRPFVTTQIIETGFRHASLWGNAITAVPLKDSIRVVENGLSQSADRDMFRLVQTPQTFRVQVIKEAYEKVIDSQEELPFTDDASVAEYNEADIHIVEGDYKNIKITTPEDLLFAESLIRSLSVSV